MKRLVLVLVCLLMLAGCAVSQLPDNATSQQKQVAMCMDAQAGLAMADAALQGVNLDPAAQQYWTAFRAGAQIGVAAYCGGK